MATSRLQEAVARCQAIIEKATVDFESTIAEAEADLVASLDVGKIPGDITKAEPSSTVNPSVQLTEETLVVSKEKFLQSQELMQRLLKAAEKNPELFKNILL